MTGDAPWKPGDLVVVSPGPVYFGSGLADLAAPVAGVVARVYDDRADVGWWWCHVRLAGSRELVRVEADRLSAYPRSA